MAERQHPTTSKQSVTRTKRKPGHPPSSTRKVIPDKTLSIEKAKHHRAASRLSEKSTTSASCITSSESEISDAEAKSSIMMQNSKHSQKTTKKEHSTDFLRVNEVEYDGKIYDLSQSYSSDSKIVQTQTESIEKKLKLTTLADDLSSLGKLVHLACCGVVGHTELEKETRNVLVNVGDITDDTYHTLNDFERTSKRALQSMQTAYAFLKENLEREALNMFKDIQKDAEKMFEKSNELSDKCKTQSKSVNELGNKTSKEKKATEEQKIETDNLINKSKIEEKHQKEIIENSIDQVDKKEKNAAVTSNDEKEVFKRKDELAKQFEEKKQSKNEDIKQRKAQLKLKFDDDNSKVTSAMAKSQEKFENTVLADKKQYNKTLKELDKTLKKDIKSAEDAYKAKVNEIKKEYKLAIEKNDKFEELEIEKQRKKYEKTCSDAEAEYRFTTNQSEKDYNNAIQKNNNELQRELTLATEKLDAALDANKQVYSAKVQECYWNKSKTKVHTEWSEEDAKSKTTKSETESDARSKNNKKNKEAFDDRETKLKDAFRDKNSKIKEAENLMTLKIDDVKEKVKKLNKNEIETKDEKIDAAESNKKETIRSYQETKENEELKAKQNKEDSEQSAKDIKQAEDDNNKLEKENLLKSYQFDLKQLDDELTKAVKEMDEEYQKELDIIDENFKYLKEQSAKYESEIKSLQKQREESYKKMLEFAQKIKDGTASSEGQQISIECLHEAKSALYKIEVIMRQASSFWKKVGKHCEDMVENVLVKQIESIKDSDSVTRKRMYGSEVFKQAALKYSGQWHALKDTCSAASEHITLVQDEINQYLCENPTKEQAVELVKKLATDMLDSDVSQRMISDKPANE